MEKPVAILVSAILEPRLFKKSQIPAHFLTGSGEQDRRQIDETTSQLSQARAGLSPALATYFTNRFQSAMLAVLRISAVAGSSFGARGMASKRRPAS